MREMLEEFSTYGGFPLVKTENEGTPEEEWILLGYIHTKELRAEVDRALNWNRIWSHGTGLITSSHRNPTDFHQVLSK